MNQPQTNSACPECQAELPDGARFCWLCGAPVSQSVADPATGAPGAPTTVPARVVSPSASAGGLWIEDDAGPSQRPGTISAETSPTHSASDAALFLLPLLVFLVLIGVWTQSQGLALLLGVLIGPPLLVTCLKSAVRTAQSRQSAGSLPAANRRGPASAARVTPMTTSEKASTFVKGLFVMLVTLGGLLSLAAICALIALVCMVTALLSICGIKP